MSDEREQRPRLPPRWFVRLAWYAHRGLSRHRRPRRPLASEEPQLGHPATHQHGASHGQDAKRDPWVLRGRSEHRHAGDEWVGRRRAVVVAQPATRSRSKSRARRRSAHGHGARRRGRRTVSLVGQVAGDRHEGGRVCGAPVVGDRGRDPRATTHTLSAPRTPHPARRAARGRGSFGVNTLSAVLRAASLARICRRDGVRARAAATTAGPGPSGRGSGRRGRGAAARGRRPGR